MSSFLDYASVSVHRTSLSLCGLLLRIPHSGCLRTTFEATFCIQPTHYAVQSGRVRQHFARMTLFGCGIYSHESFIRNTFYMLSGVPSHDALGGTYVRPSCPRRPLHIGKDVCRTAPEGRRGANRRRLGTCHPETVPRCRCKKRWFGGKNKENQEKAK